jgi:hypothetical protein
MPLTSDADIRTLLENSKTVAVVGYSDDADRPSHTIAHRLIGLGYKVYFVNPTLVSNEARTIYANVADIPERIDIVDVFRRPEAVPEVVEDAIAAGAKAVWMQLRIVNEAAARRAEAAGLQVVMNRCIKVEHSRLRK